ncbi:MAG: penicillin-binding protein activator [Sphingomonadaceae bacterium]
MKANSLNRRQLVIAGAAVFLAGCQMVPKTTAPTTPPVTTPTPKPGGTSLPTDTNRHRIALLVPVSGDNGAVGKGISNAATMALLDTNADNLRITTYDTASGVQTAARRAVADGNELILGPLMSESVTVVNSIAQSAKIPMISFSNDTGVAGPNVFVMGLVPEQVVARTVNYARGKGATRFAALLPEGQYGDREEAALAGSLLEWGGTLATTERYARGNTSIISATRRLTAKGGYDTVLIADGARFAEQAADILRPRGSGSTQLMGTELWSGESSVTKASSLRGAWFSSISDARFKRFADSYKTRFGGQPYRVSTLGYDSVLLTLRIAQEWKPGKPFPIQRMYDRGGFLGLDGAFRFGRDGVVERALEVREVRDGQVVIVSPAPAKFED